MSLPLEHRLNWVKLLGSNKKRSVSLLPQVLWIMAHHLWLRLSTNNPELDQEGQYFREYDLPVAVFMPPMKMNITLNPWRTSAALFSSTAAYLIEQIAWYLEAALGLYMLGYVKYRAFTIMNISFVGHYKTKQTLWTLWTYEVHLTYSKMSCVQAHFFH